MEGDALRVDDRKETTVLEGSSSPSILETSIQSASSSKVSNTIFDLDSSMCDIGRTDISGNRIFDITILVGVLELLGCPNRPFRCYVTRNVTSSNHFELDENKRFSSVMAM